MAERGGARVRPGSAGPRRATHGDRPGRARLSRSADFDRVFRHGRSYGSRELVLYVFPRGEGASEATGRNDAARHDEADGYHGAPARRLGLSVSRKVGGAVQRNRVKRLIREAFASESSGLPAGSDAVVVARPEARGLAEREGLVGIQRALADLIGRATAVHS